MRLKITSLLILLVLSTGTYAGFEGPGATTKLSTVKSIGGARDDTKVTLQGSLIKQIKEEHYIFKDETGEIEVEIDDAAFKGQKVTTKTKIRIIGEVDKDWGDMTVEVEYLEIIK